MHMFNAKRKGARAIIAAAVGVTVLVASGCSQSASGDGSPSQNSEPVSVTVGYLLGEFMTPSLWQAEAAGYWTDRNLDVELVKFDNGTQMVQALAGGSLDAAVGGAAITAGYAAAGNGVFAGPIVFETDYLHLFANPAQASSVADLVGQTVLLPVGTTGHVLLKYAADDAGVDMADINVVNAGFSDVGPAFLGGAGVGGVTGGPFLTAVEQQAPDTETLATLGDFFPEHAVPSGLVISNTFVQEDREAAIQLLAGTMLGTEAVLDDPDVMTAIFDEHFADVESREQFDANAASVDYPSAEDWLGYMEDGSLAAWMEELVNTLNELGGSIQLADASSYIDADLYQAALDAR